MRGLIFIVLCVLSTTGVGQNIHFIKSYGNTGYDIAKDIKQSLDTGYIVTGSSSSFIPDNAEAFLFKVDSLGNYQWSYNYGGTGSDWGESVILTNDSGYAISGFTNSSGNGGFDFYLVKTDSLGTPLWEKTYGGGDWDKSFDLQQMPDSGFILVGETYSYGGGGTDIYVVRTDKFGDTVWTRTYGGMENDVANAVLVDGDSLVVVGSTESFGNGMKDGIILKYHIDGTLGWSKVVGMEREDYFTSIVKNTVNEYFIGGSRTYYYDQTGFLNDFWIYNISSDGNILYGDTSMTGGSHEVEIAHDLVIDPLDNIYYGGSTKSFGYATLDFKEDAFLGKLQSNYYQASYIQNFGEAGKDVVYGMDFCYDGGVVATGELAFNSTGGGNFFIAKVDKDNTLLNFQVITDLQYEDLTLSAENFNSSESLNIYPTIVENNLNIEGFNNKGQLQIVDMNGGLQASFNSIPNKIDLSKLHAGMYILIITTESNTYTTKLIKN
ncbi:MAG: T9SS type A sorting domain-containing protein [Crocinitomicaceae bacterium]